MIWGLYVFCCSSLPLYMTLKLFFMVLSSSSFLTIFYGTVIVESFLQLGWLYSLYFPAAHICFRLHGCFFFFFLFWVRWKSNSGRSLPVKKKKKNFFKFFRALLHKYPWLLASLAKPLPEFLIIAFSRDVSDIQVCRSTGGDWTCYDCNKWMFVVLAVFQGKMYTITTDIGIGVY